MKLIIGITKIARSQVNIYRYHWSVRRTRIKFPLSFGSSYIYCRCWNSKIRKFKISKRIFREIWIPSQWPQVFFNLYVTLDDLKNLSSAQSWAKLVSQWERGENLRLLQRYYLNKYHHNLNEECDTKCINDIICFIKSAAKDDHLYKELCAAHL